MRVKMIVPSLKEGYNWAYEEFYKWNNIITASLKHDKLKQQLKHLFYTGDGKKWSPFGI